MKKRNMGNKGSTLILVMVAIAFIALLGTSMLAASAINNTMKEVDKNSKKVFYSADGIMEKIKAGLVIKSSKASMIAYEEVLAKYTSTVEDTTTSVQEVFNQTYMEEIKKEFFDGEDAISGNYYYDVDKIESLLASDAEKAFYCKVEIKNQNENILEMHPTERYMVFKNMMVRVANSSGYETQVKADIRLQTPELTFSKDTAIYTEFSKYALIADNKLVVNPFVNATVKGSIYSGIVQVNNPSLIDNKNAGIEVNQGSLDFIGESLVSRGDIMVYNGGKLNIGNLTEGKKSNVWVENIKIGNVSSFSGSLMNENKISVNGTLNVADDMEINGEKDYVTLGGEYFGYNYDKEYSSSTYVTQPNAQYSSSIIMNGKKATLNMENLSMLVLAGRTFISKGGAGEEFVASNQNKDIMLGESLSVRSNQVVYYVPSKYVTGPETNRELDVAGYEDYLGFTVDTYLVPEKMLVPYYLRNAGGVIYYEYLNFRNEESANEFYRQYFKYHPTAVKNNMDPYLSSAGIVINPSTILLLSGNVLYKDASTQTANIKVSNQTTPSYIMKMYAQLKGREYKSRQLKLVENAQEAQSGEIRLSNKAMDPLYKSLVKDNVIRNELSGVSNQRKVIPVSGLGNVIISDEATFVWNDTKNAEYGGNRGIIICNGDVALDASFQGMILSGGNITFRATGTSLIGDEYLVQNMMRTDTEKEFLKYLNVEVTEENVNIAADFDYEGYVYYENWKKN